MAADGTIKGTQIADAGAIEDIDAMLLIETEPIRKFFLETDTVRIKTRALIMAMEELSVKYPKSWLLLNLLFFEEVTAAEIALASGGRVTMDQIRKDKHRALGRLRKILNNYPGFTEDTNSEGDEHDGE